MLQRGCSYHEIVKEDYPWMWAAYRRGSFKDLPMDQQLSSDDFIKILEKIIDIYYDREGTIVISEAYFSEHGSSAPVCATFVDYNQKALFPHAFWFSWATPRNKIECTVDFLKYLIKDNNVLIFSEKKTEYFFSHMARYGILNRRGILKKYFPGGGDAIIFQGRK